MREKGREGEGKMVVVLEVCMEVRLLVVVVVDGGGGVGIELSLVKINRQRGR